MSNIIEINRGSDVRLAGVWRDSTGAAMDMTGWAIELFQPNFPAGASMSVIWTDAAAGEYYARMEWVDGITLGRTMNFRLRASRDGDDVSSPLIWITVK
jgi:hypothetical protein